MNTQERAEIGVIGLAVMGRNLALNMLGRGIRVAGWNRDPSLTRLAVEESEGRLAGAGNLEELIAGLERPRRVWLMIAAGPPVDAVLGQLRELLEPGDIVIEGGNSRFQDTRRRERELREAGLHFFGVGVSGGEDGARHGPSLMPGGDADAYELIRPVLEAIAARTDSGACVTHVGPDGAGHFVKMVHNGIEYADMQFIAEAYHLMRDGLGLEPPGLARIFGEWNRGPLESFLIEITAKIFGVPDESAGGWLVDRVLDRAGQKGTGRWTAQNALELGVPVPSIAAAIDARVLSSRKPERAEASALLAGPPPPDSPDGEERDRWIGAIHDALYASKISAYAQGMDLIRAASEAYAWSIDPGEMARIWKGGCIIRARFLDDIMGAYGRDRALPNLILDPEFRGRIHETQGAWREVVGFAQASGIPVPAMSASLAYYDSLRTGRLPQNLTQAQRDAFGAHTYQRDDVGADPPFVHSDWLY